MGAGGGTGVAAGILARTRAAGEYPDCTLAQLGLGNMKALSSSTSQPCGAPAAAVTTLAVGPARANAPRSRWSPARQV